MAHKRQRTKLDQLPKYCEWHGDKKKIRIKYPIPKDIQEFYPITNRSKKRGAKKRFQTFRYISLGPNLLSAKRHYPAAIRALHREFDTKCPHRALDAEAERWKIEIARDPLSIPRSTHCDGEPLSPEELQEIEYELSARDLLVNRAYDLEQSVGIVRAMKFFKRASGQGATIEETLAKWLETYRGPGSKKQQYRRTIDLLVKWCKLHRIAPRMVEINVSRAKRFYNERLSGDRGARSVANEKSILSQFWDWYLRRAHVSLMNKLAEGERTESSPGENPWRII